MILEENITGRILEIAKDLTQPTEYSMLLQKIINDAMDITNCDGGTLYIMQNIIRKAQGWKEAQIINKK